LGGGGLQPNGMNKSGGCRVGRRVENWDSGEENSVRKRTIDEAISFFSFHRVQRTKGFWTSDMSVSMSNQTPDQVLRRNEARTRSVAHSRLDWFEARFIQHYYVRVSAHLSYSGNQHWIG
jgi:hypothetical protein